MANAASNTSIGGNTRRSRIVTWFAQLSLARQLTAMCVLTAASALTLVCAAFLLFARAEPPAIVAAIFAAAFLLSIVVASNLQRLITRPLAAGFNKMVEEIEQRDRTLLGSRDQLEANVEARTAELRALNTDLMIARDKAMDASRAKSEFLANMSHEIRTPMNGIIGMTALALAGELEPETRECLETVRMSAESLLAILNDILDFSKIESRKLELESVSFALADMVNEMLKPFAVQADQKNIDLILNIAPEVPQCIVGDPLRLQQVLANLVGNALKFTERGHVLVELREDTRVNQCTMLHFTVSDTGIGVPTDKHTTIFEAFSQADGSTTRRFGGTGLGLTISANLVHMMGGKIWLESEPGVGTTFHVTAPFDIGALPEPASRAQLPGTNPAVAAMVVEVTEPSEDGTAPRRSKILLAEDNVVNQRVAVGLLQRRGHDVTVANNGREAIDFLERERFDLVLMDVQMPEMGGFEATAAIRERERANGGYTRIVAMTAHAMTGDRDRCIASGMDGYLSKPINQALLFEVVEQGSVGADVRPTPFNRTELIDRLGGDVDLLGDVIQLFLDDCPKRLAAIKTAVEHRDPEAIRSTAHALKGAAGTIAAAAVFEAAQTLERVGAEKRLDAAEAAWRVLAGEAANLMDTLRKVPSSTLKGEQACTR